MLEDRPDSHDPETGMDYDTLFNPTEEHRMLREMVAEFTTQEVEPQAAEFDEKGVMNVPLFRQLGAPIKTLIEAT